LRDDSYYVDHELGRRARELGRTRDHARGARASRPGLEQELP
jgi:hypothetical protein